MGKEVEITANNMAKLDIGETVVEDESTSRGEGQ